jgi:hypothetical protein
MVGPGAGLGEQREVWVLLNQPLDRVTRLGLEFLEGDLTNNLVPRVAPRRYLADEDETEEYA